MGQRTQLQSLLETITPKVYFQPPANIQLEYPCIVYKRDKVHTEFADNSPYRLTKRYLVTVIDRDPDSFIPDSVASIPMCLANRTFAANNLNHDVFILYF